MMRRRKIGKVLQLGDCIGIVAPATAIGDYDVMGARSFLHHLGYKTKMAPSVYASYGYLAGTDVMRANDLNDFFADDTVNAILCLRGGYGATRILDLLDYDLISAHPKLFIGYSDITAIHTALGERCRLATIHGPMLTSFRQRYTRYTAETFATGISSVRPIGEFPMPPRRKLVSLRPGTATGTIVGGNLSLLAALTGTPYELSGIGGLLVIEEVGEEPYSLDRMLRQLWQSGLLRRVGGIIFGEFTHCNPKKNDTYEFTVDEVLQQYAMMVDVPVLSGLPVGHGRYNAFLPLGVEGTIISNDGQAVFTINKNHCSAK